MHDARDITGVMGGSRLYNQPQYQHELRAWHAFLEPSAPILVEVGFDHGRRLSATAAAWPAWRVGGLEIRKLRVEQLKTRAIQTGLDQLFAWRADARAVLANHTPPESIDILEALFPDPWWREHLRAKRALLTASWLQDVARVLKPGGIFHVATDVPHVAAWLIEALACAPELQLDPSAAQERPAIAAMSRREWRCQQDNVQILRYWMRKKT